MARRGPPRPAQPERTRPAAAGRSHSVLSLAWPSLVENLLLLAMSMASLMMVGRLGPAAMAGVGIANQVAMLLQVLFMGLSVGNLALVARATGSGQVGAAQPRRASPSSWEGRSRCCWWPSASPSSR